MQYLFVTLCLLSWVTSNLAAQSAAGDPKAWKRYQSAGEKALKAKDSLEAERQFTLAVAEAEKIRKGEGKLQESLDDLAPLLVNHRKYEAALAAYERLCVLYAKDVGSNSLKVAEALFGFAQSCKFGKRLFEAEDALLRARAIIERKTEPTHTARILVQGELASVHRRKGGCSKQSRFTNRPSSWPKTRVSTISSTLTERFRSADTCRRTSCSAVCETTSGCSMANNGAGPRRRILSSAPSGYTRPAVAKIVPEWHLRSPTWGISISNK